jgi:hypothetical protein
VANSLKEVFLEGNVMGGWETGQDIMKAGRSVFQIKGEVRFPFLI